jgi:siroheme synthase
MVALAASGLRVVRLKGGDPLIFGRAGEEIEALRAASISYEIVPGVTSAMGAAAAVQIPLTHRRASSALVLLTAHYASDNETATWNKLAASGATLVIYMPGQNYADIAGRLKAADLPGDTPCAIVSRATTRHQRTHITTAGNLHRAPQLAAPTLLVVGDVVRFADPVALTQDFVVPTVPANIDAVPALLPNFSTQIFESQKDEEPLA